VLSLPQELLIQQRGLRNLILRNREVPLELLQTAAGDGVGSGNGPTPLQLPFMIIQASSEAKVELQMSEDSTQVQFDFHRCVDYDCSTALYIRHRARAPYPLPMPCRTGLEGLPWSYRIPKSSNKRLAPACAARLSRCTATTSC